MVRHAPWRRVGLHADGGAGPRGAPATRCRTRSWRLWSGTRTCVRRVNLPRSVVPAITHVDYSARVQTVDERHGRFHALMERFYAKTGCPVLVNTSFNLSWEPIVLTPEEAYHTFMQSEMDVLVLENVVLHKAAAAAGPEPPGPATAPEPAEAAASPWADPATGDPLVVSASSAPGTSGPARRIRWRTAFHGSSCRPMMPSSPAATSPRSSRQFYEKTPFPELRRRRHAAGAAREGAGPGSSRACSTSRFPTTPGWSRSAVAPDS